MEDGAENKKTMRGFGPGAIGPRLIVVAAAVAAAIVMIMAAPAFGAAVHPFLGSFCEPSGLGVEPCEPSFGQPGGIAVDPADGDLLVIDLENRTLSRFTAAGAPDPFSALGDNVIDGHPGQADETPQGEILGDEGNGGSESQVAVAPPGASGGTAGDIYVTDALHGVIDVFAHTGEYLGQRSLSYPCGVTVDSSGDVFVGDYVDGVHKLIPSAPASFVESSASPYQTPEPCQVAAGSGPTDGFVFATQFNGPVRKIASAGPAEGETRYVVSPGPNRTVAVDPLTGYVDAAPGETAPATGSTVVEFDASGEVGAQQVSMIAAPAAEERPVDGVTVSSVSGRPYVSHIGSANLDAYGPLASTPVATFGSASDITETTAVLNGAVDPEDGALTSCAFEYGTNTAYGSSVPCEPAAETIPSDGVDHPVRAEITGLPRGRTIHARLVVANAAGTVRSDDASFSTAGVPLVIEEGAGYLDRHAATLTALVDTKGLPTSYRFEYLPLSSYEASGFAAPSVTQAADGSQVDSDLRQRVEVPVTGLSESTPYVFRVIAANASGTTAGAPDRFATCGPSYDSGLPDCRGAELVSPAQRGPLAIAGETTLFTGLAFFWQVATDGSEVSFEMAPGGPETTSGGEVLYQGRRTPFGWISRELTPPVTSLINRPPQSNVPSIFKYFSPNLDCGIVQSQLPLAANAPKRTVEAGGLNLFRVQGGSFTTITDRAPAKPEDGGEPFQVVGTSPGCGRVLFESSYEYGGVSFGSGDAWELYEWNESAEPHLRPAGVVPGPSGEEVVRARAGDGAFNYFGAVSGDASKIVFTATRLVSQNPEEIGKKAVYVRTDGRETTDVSLSETSTPDTGATYRDASKDGSHVFFTADAGLTASSSPEGTDLYEYDFDKPSGERLTDLSVDTNPSDSDGAAVRGVLGTSDDGAYVYFAARGQLLAGEGPTYAENVAAGSYSLYLAHEGTLDYVGGFGEIEARHNIVSGAGLSNASGTYLATVTPDGAHLVFESGLRLTSYDSGGASEAYLYSAATGATVCVSCRRDGAAPIVSPLSIYRLPLATALTQTNPLGRRLNLSADGDRVFFQSLDPLAPEAVAGNLNIYEWDEGTVYLLASGGAANVQEGGSGGQVLFPEVEFVGAGEEGDDVFIATSKRLAPQAEDDRRAVYDLRVGGGFPAGDRPAPCDPLREASCGGPSTGGPRSVPPATSTFVGPANPVRIGRACGKGRRAVKVRGKRRCIVRHKRKGHRHHGGHRGGVQRHASHHDRRAAGR